MLTDQTALPQWQPPQHLNQNNIATFTNNKHNNQKHNKNQNNAMPTHNHNNLIGLGTKP